MAKCMQPGATRLDNTYTVDCVRPDWFPGCTARYFAGQIANVCWLTFSRMLGGNE